MALPAAGTLVSERRVLNLATGELLDLDSAVLGDLAQARDAIVQMRAALDEAGHRLDDEIASRLDHENERSAEVGPYKLTVNAPEARSWNIDRLQVALDELVNEGRLGAGVRTRALTTTVTYKAVARELNKLLTHDDPAVRVRIAECLTLTPAVRRVAVTPTGRTA